MIFEKHFNPVILTQPTITALIDKGCEFEGKLCFQGTVRIGGIFHGEIFTPDTLIVIEGAHVFAQIEAGVIIISGEVSGSLRAKYRVEIHKPAIFRGDILTPSLKVDEGVIFEGMSKMSQGVHQTLRGEMKKDF